MILFDLPPAGGKLCEAFDTLKRPAGPWPCLLFIVPGRWGVQVPIGFHDDHGGDDDLEEFHDDVHHRHGDLGILLLAEHRAQGPC